MYLQFIYRATEGAERKEQSRGVSARANGPLCDGLNATAKIYDCSATVLGILVLGMLYLLMFTWSPPPRTRCTYSAQK